MFRVSNDWDNKSFVLEQVQEEESNYLKVSPRLKKDYDVIIKAIAGNSVMFDKIDPSIYQNIKFYDHVSKDPLGIAPRGLLGRILLRAPENITNNKELMIRYKDAVPRNMYKNILGPKLVNNRDFWKSIIKENPRFFSASPFFDDKEMTLYYLQKLAEYNIRNKSDRILVWVSDRLNSDQEVVQGYTELELEAGLRYMSRGLQSDFNFMSFLWDIHEDHHDLILKYSSPEVKEKLAPGTGSPSYSTNPHDYEDDEYQDEDFEYLDDSYENPKEYIHSKKEVDLETKKTDFSYLFKNNIHKLALSLYKGKKSTVVSLFKLYSYIVDIRSNDIEEANLFRGKTLPLWRAVLKEQSKQFTPEEKVTATITQSLQVIDAYFKKNKQPLDSPSLQQEKVTLYKASRYKTLIVNLLQYLISFFNHMGIRVKPLQIVSDVSNIKVIGLMADTVGEAPAVSQLLSQVSAIKDKLTLNLLDFFKISGGIDQFLSVATKDKIRGIEYYTYKGYYISLDTAKKYSNLEELLADVTKEKIIDKNYSQLQVSQGKVILPSKNKVVKTINYLTPAELKADIQQYQISINGYNAKLQSYEKKLSNEPKTIQLGDHLVNTVKVFYRNISRLVVIDGPYQGHFVDELVSSTGEVIGSVGKASAPLTETSKVLKTIDKSNLEFMFSEPIEFSNLQKISDYVSPKNLDTVLDEEYLEGIDLNVPEIPKNIYHNIVGNSILLNMGNESKGIKITLKLENDTTITNYITKLDKHDATSIEMVRTIDTQALHIHNHLFVTSKCFPEGLGTRIFTQQVKSASEVGFYDIGTLAARGGRFMGYYVWPKMGYNANVFISKQNVVENPKFLLMYQYLEKWLKKNSTSYKGDQFSIAAPISDIYACKVKDRFIGQELWKEFGGSTSMTFDLKPSSLSMRILEAYITLKAKKEGLDPKDYLNVDYARFVNYSLDCLLDKFMGSNFYSYDLQRRLQDSVRNYENGELFKIYQNPKTRPKLIYALQFLKKDSPKLVEDVVLVLKQKGYENVKFASDNKIEEDPMIREIDESIVKQVWDGINKLYEAGTFK